MRSLLSIALAGALGSVARHLVGASVQRLGGGALPYGTFAVNVIGSFCIGLLMTLFALRGQLDSELRIALTMGFLGGFTTYSSFALETVQLVQNRQLLAAGVYVATMLIAAAAACAGGIALVRWLR